MGVSVDAHPVAVQKLKADGSSAVDRVTVTYSCAPWQGASPAWGWKAQPFWKIHWALLGRKQWGAARAWCPMVRSAPCTTGPVASTVTTLAHRLSPNPGSSSSLSSGANPAVAAVEAVESRPTRQQWRLGIHGPEQHTSRTHTPQQHLK